MNAKTALFEPGMKVTWIDQVPQEDGVRLMTEDEITESLRQKGKEIATASSRVYSNSVHLLAKMKQIYGLGPFTVLRVSEKFASHDTCHPQQVKINAVPLQPQSTNICSQFISGFWLKPAS